MLSADGDYDRSAEGQTSLVIAYSGKRALSVEEMRRFGYRPGLLAQLLCKR
ncbi:MAG: hypothetical protein K6U75_05470 [Firmicutes bacterium]|nr:hypothetical protein [Bacillota bacterium]